MIRIRRFVRRSGCGTLSLRSNRETVRMPIRTLLRDQDERVDKRIEAAMNRMTDAIKDFKVEAEKSAEQRRMEFREFRAELKADVAKSLHEKLETFYWRLVVTFSGMIVVLVPSSLLGFEFFRRRILFPGNR